MKIIIAITIQYIAKKFKFLLLAILTRNFIERNPEINAKTKLKIMFNVTERSCLKIISDDLVNSKIKAPKITGIDRSIENITHSSRFNPNERAKEIVVPDLDIPGKIAIA